MACAAGKREDAADDGMRRARTRDPARIDKYLIVVLIFGWRLRHTKPTMQIASSLALSLDLLLLRSGRGGCCRRF